MESGVPELTREEKFFEAIKVIEQALSDKLVILESYGKTKHIPLIYVGGFGTGSLELLEGEDGYYLNSIGNLRLITINEANEEKVKDLKKQLEEAEKVYREAKEKFKSLEIKAYLLDRGNSE